MWNHGIPYILKQFIDVVSQPGLVFQLDPEHGYTGLLTGRTAAVIYTGAVWGPGRGPEFGTDFAQPYFDDSVALGRDQRHHETVRFQPNLATADSDSARRVVHAQARDVGKAF